MEDIIYGLLSDKSELVQIAQAYEEELIAQRISADDIEYISTNFVPLLQRLIKSASDNDSPDGAAEEIIELIQPLLSVETVTILQLIGFNFRKAIGEPLTELVSKLILSKTQPDPALVLEVQLPTLFVRPLLPPDSSESRGSCPPSRNERHAAIILIGNTERACNGAACCPPRDCPVALARLHLGPGCRAPG